VRIDVDPGLLDATARGLDSGAAGLVEAADQVTWALTVLAASCGHEEAAQAARRAAVRWRGGLDLAGEAARGLGEAVEAAHEAYLGVDGAQAAAISGHSR